MTDSIRVFLADDHPLIRRGIRAALQAAPDMILVGETADGYTARHQCQELRPDVVVLDLQMPGPPPFALIADLRADRADVKLIILTAHDDDAYVRGALAASVAGYLLKDEDSEVVVRAIRTVAQSGAWFSQSIATKVARLVGGEPPAPPALALSAQEVEMLRLVAAGKTNREIGTLFEVSEKAIEKRLSELFVKLGVATRIEAAVRAVRQGLV
jgi:DNA-binding NarL/FixJ family response regulator